MLTEMMAAFQLELRSGVSERESPKETEDFAQDSYKVKKKERSINDGTQNMSFLCVNQQTELSVIQTN